MRRRIIAFAFLFAIAGTANAQTVGYYRQPTIAGNTIVFVSEGDLWKVDVAGGNAQRLTTNAWEETNPQISPDGKTIAFTGRYDGVADVYTIPLAGGTPVRHSWDAGSLVVGWKGNDIVYTTLRYSTLPMAQLVTVNAASNVRSLIPLSQAYDGAWDGDVLYFTRNRPQSSNTKRYQGGTAQNIWRFDGKTATCLTCDFAGTSRGAHVYNHRVYFVSDRDKVMNLWSMDENGKDLLQLTHHTDYDVRDFSISSEGKVVYQQGADLRLLDLGSPNMVAKASGEPRKLNITITSDLNGLSERWVKNPMQYLTDYHIDKTGDRVSLIARGMLFVAPVGEGRFIAYPNDGSVRYRSARFAPDGKSIYTLNDKSGEVEVWRDGEQLTKDATILRWDLDVSPDGKYVAHNDKNQRLYLCKLTDRQSKGTATRSRGTGSPPPGVEPACEERVIAESKYSDYSYWWSPDSRSLLFVDVAPNQIEQLKSYDVASGTTSTLTGDEFDSESPAVTPDGEWLYFLSDRTYNTSVYSPWGARQPEPHFEKQTKIYAVQLKKGSAFAFAPKSEVAWDTTKVASGIFEVPIDAGNYSNLSTDGKRLYWTSYDSRYSGGNPKIMSLELSNKPETKPETFAEGIRGGYELSGDMKKVLFRKADDLYVVDAGAKAPSDLSKSKVDLSGWMLSVERKQEMPELFADAWRLERDYFYDPGMNGQDWKAMRAKYQPLAERVANRAELSDVLAQMVGELSALHIFVYGGDLPAGADTIPHASLGAVLSPASGGWKIDHIYRNDPELTGEQSPLAMPGVGLSEGDVISAINGVALSSVQHPAELLYGKAGKQVLVETTNGKKAIVYPISLGREQSLRYSEWEWTRKQMVDKLSGGKIGYVHLRAMSGNDMNQFQRDFYPQFNKDALIVDVRNNNGGNIDSWVLEKLARKPWMYFQPRVGEPSWNMQYAFRGPMATIVNEWSSSDGEAFPEGFRRLGLGKVVGTRTWGGEIWLSSSNVLADRGIATAAETGVYGPEGKWLIEGHGVDPDVVVDNNPASTFSGSDSQLETTVKLLLDEVAKHPVSVPKAPAYPKK